MQYISGNFEGKLSEKLPRNTYTVNTRYLRHMASAIRHIGPPRSYSARPMERIIGMYSRGIKSKVAPGVNAGKIMMRISATRDYERSQLVQTPSDPTATQRSNAIYSVSVEKDAAEIWDCFPARLDDERLSTVDVQRYLKEYWKRALKQRTLPILSTAEEIVIGKRLFLEGAVYDCAMFSSKENRRSSTFVKLSLPVNSRPFNSNTEGVDEMYTYFGEAICFFAHAFEEEEERLLALVKICTRVEETEYGMPYTSASGDKPQSDFIGRYYITEVENIDCVAGCINSATHNNRRHIAYPGVVSDDRKLGPARRI
ncbi:hypothetical protein BCR43DRAFT_509065 [Syncephalastrum racemosum]|uniref:Uncharacterized protein n=1 Tax=Syncephalastrum racemosum TaxID=13706 RepID=A0A1X2H0L4_SYNRA|nr:hypothetical protein BCR43DRAFT_509065 [Syncephalastrum racemosum]